MAGAAAKGLIGEEADGRHPEIVIVGLLPPLLFVAALETSVPAFRFNLRPILLLAVGHVLFIAVLVGLVVYALVPDVPFAICLALGAVVAPPDAIAATALARRIGLPRRIVTILEGESLLNDATALVLFRVAALAAVGEATGAWEITSELVRAAGGGLLVGVIGAVFFRFLHERTKDPLLDNALSLLTPLSVALAAEAIHASGVVAVVVAGLYLGHRLPTLMSAASRLQMGAFWRMVKFLLEGLVFLMVGLQLPAVARLLRPPPDDPTRDILSEAAVQQAASRAARERLDALADGAPRDVVERLRTLTEHRSNAAWERLGGATETPTQTYVRLRRERRRDDGRRP